MRCLVLHQPWASLCLSAKKHETRSWPAPASISGRRVSIASAKTEDGWKYMGDELRAFINTKWGPQTQRQVDRNFPRGVIVCTAVIASCIPTDDARPGVHDRLCGDWSAGRYGWLLRDVIDVQSLLVPSFGKQGVFRIDDETYDRLDVLGAVGNATRAE